MPAAARLATAEHRQPAATTEHHGALPAGHFAHVGRVTRLVKRACAPRWLGLGWLRSGVRVPAGLTAGGASAGNPRRKPVE